VIVKSVIFKEINGGGENLNKGLVAIIVIILIILVAAGAWFLMKPAANNTTNTSNSTISSNNQTTHNNTTNTTNITAAKAKELAQQYIGMGVTLGTVTLTTYKNVKVWKISVQTVGTNQTADYIYINANTGKRVE